ncbi:cadherin repeat domain-containing protein [Flagellimonas marinaquae]|uniref:cadherin repeat domain-containing protein n=1 Tax=Flagellimonas marinaquae TaxID=254955 RepID=UPI000F8F22E0|nr:cadherin repeat domain-containing protein [Allomuricauda aquimarina]
MLRKNYAVLHREKGCNAKIQAKLYFSVLIVLFTLCSSCSKDDPKSEEVIVTVNTVDKTFTIDENPTENQFIGTVPGTTNQGGVTFSIIEQIPVGAFRIDAKTGQLYVDNTSIYDFETNTSITGKIKVENGNVSKESAIVITINDVDEDIFVGSVELRSQEEVDEFGLNKYREITGDLRITKGDDLEDPIIDLSSLNTLETIGGNLAISATSTLQTLEGLNNIGNVNKCIIFDNPNIEDISALEGIMVTSFINVSYNPKITSLGVFSNIQSLESGIQITENNSITSLQGFNNLISTGGGVRIVQNENLNNVFDLNSLTTIGGSLVFNNNPNLINLNGLNNLETVEGNVWLMDNERLFDINGLQNLTSFNGEMIINFCDELQNVDGLKGITSIELLQIVHCDSIQNLDGIANLTSVDVVSIRNNDSLNDFCGLTTLINNNFSGSYTVVENLYNPTIEDILNDNCSNE